MTKDSMITDIAVDYDAGLARFEPSIIGGRYWPELIYAHETGYRPLGLDLTVPGGDGRHPLVILIHGGGWFTGHPKITNPVLEGMEISATLIKAGYAVARPAYRLSDEAIFPAQLHDCKSAIRYLRAHADTLGIDSRRFAAMGESAGGHLACMLGLTGQDDTLEGSVGLAGPSSAVQAVINWYGPTDLLTMDRQSPANAIVRHDNPYSPEARLIGGPVQENPESARRASPLFHVAPRCPPFLIQHGDQDRLVPIGQARSLAQALENHGVTVQLTELAGGDHCFWGADTASIMLEVIAFLRQHL
ncbi:MAG: alpha/beta hydrolase [Rhizobiales bacterium]|nr:alpha/beta hydrolase [Hyphomicrobiales bacterium]